MSGPVVAYAAVEIPAARLDVEEEILGAAGIGVLDLRDLPLAAIAGRLATADAIVTEGIERLDAAVVESLERCRGLSIFAVGTDGVDVAAATRRGIPVANVPDYCTVEVAEHTVALILAAWRKLPQAQRVARGGSFALDPLLPLRRLGGHTVGLLGFGRIAREVASRLRAFEVELIAHDPVAGGEAAATLGVQLVDLETLYRRAHVLSIHVPLTEATRGLVGAAALAALPEGAVVVNAGRGGVVDEDALAAALRSGRVAGAGLDVLAAEPPPVDHPLLGIESVLVTPHMAYCTDESLHQLRLGAAANARAMALGERPATVVNPEVYGATTPMPAPR